MCNYSTGSTQVNHPNRNNYNFDLGSAQVCPGQPQAPTVPGDREGPGSAETSNITLRQPRSRFGPGSDREA